MFGLVNNKEGTIMWNIQIHLLPLNSTNELLDIFHYKSAPSNEIEILLTIRCSETVLHVSDVSKYFAHNNVITGKRINNKHWLRVVTEIFSVCQISNQFSCTRIYYIIPAFFSDGP